VAILHDRKDLTALSSASEAVEEVSEAVFVEGTREEQARAEG
jgi:hypothetical protein